MNTLYNIYIINKIKSMFIKGIPLQDFQVTCRKYCNFKTIFYQVVMGTL